MERSKEEVLNSIIDEYGEEIKRLIFTYVKNHAQTDDIFQDFLLTVFNHLDQFEERASLKTWLYRIAINKCKDYLRSPIHRFIQYKAEMNFNQENKSIEEQVMKKEQEQLIVDAIFWLPIKYREVLILRYYKFFSIKETADALGLNESTVKTRIMRGKKKLQLKLGGDFINEYE